MYQIWNILSLDYLVGSTVDGFRCDNYQCFQSNEVRVWKGMNLIPSHSGLTRRLSFLITTLRIISITVSLILIEGVSIKRRGCSVLSRFQLLLIRLSHYVCIYAGFENPILEIWRWKWESGGRQEERDNVF